MGCIILFFLVLALLVYPPLLLLAAVVGIGATIHYFATHDWDKDRKEGLFALALVVLALIILGAGYASFGVPGVVVGVIIILAFVGYTS